MKQGWDPIHLVHIGSSSQEKMCLISSALDSYKMDEDDELYHQTSIQYLRVIFFLLSILRPYICTQCLVYGSLSIFGGVMRIFEAKG